jgi:ammonium transporter Rh
MKDLANSHEGPSGNMYTYQEDKKSNIIESNALRRSLGGNNPNLNPNYNIPENVPLKPGQDLSPDTVTIHIDQSPPLYWMFFIVFMIIQIIILLFIGFYYQWDDDYTSPKSINTNSTNNLTLLTDFLYNDTNTYGHIKYKYKLFQEVNIMIFFGFGFLRAFLKHYSWTAVALTLIAGILSIEFGLFTLICWSAIFDVDWHYGKFNFHHLLDANMCAGAVIISLGTILGKISMPQYLILILTETITVTLNYTLLRQVLKIIDVGGTLTMHLYGALFGGIFSFITFFSKNEQKRIRESRHLGSTYYSNIFAIIGNLILISYFPAFNTSLINDDLYRTIDNSNLLKIKPKFEGMINTYFALIGSIIGTFCTSPFLNNGKLVLQDILNSSFSGGIAVGGCCHLINHYWVSIIFGLFTGGVTTFLSNFCSKKLNLDVYHDTANVIYYHGIPGLIGGIFTTIFVGNMPKIVKNDNEKKKYVYQYIGKFLNY